MLFASGSWNTAPAVGPGSRPALWATYVPSLPVDLSPEARAITGIRRRDFPGTAAAGAGGPRRNGGAPALHGPHQRFRPPRVRLPVTGAGDRRRPYHLEAGGRALGLARNHLLSRSRAGRSDQERERLRK